MKIVGVVLIILISSIYLETFCQSDDETPWKIVIASKEEPGEPLIVSGTVYPLDGKRALEGITIYVYHTDNRGYYSNDGKEDSPPRLKGLMKTNAQGRYEFLTIKPASYPNSRNPAHIHFVVSGPGYIEKIFEIVFEKDPFITDEIRNEAIKESGAVSIRPLSRDSQGVLRCVNDIRLEKE
jgi:protocatechuate 3,4-dioxygenase, beta subunit